MIDNSMDYYFSEDASELIPEPQSPKTPQNDDGSGSSKVGSVLSIIFVSLLAAVLLGAVIYSLDKRNTLYNKATALNNELHIAEAENVRLQSELESQMSAKNVEDYAENVLGMRKIDSSQIEYIRIRTGDVVVIPDKEESILTRVKNFFEDCVEYFRG